MAGLVTEWKGRGEAIVLAWVAGGLFLVEGFYLLLTSSVTLPFGSVSALTAGALSTMAGLGIAFLAAFYRSYGGARAYFGVVIVLIAAGDLWFGGGFWVGSVVGTIAGVLVIVLPPYTRVRLPE